MKKSLLFFFLLAWCCAITSVAQAQTVTGKVTSEDDSAPLPGVSVKVKGTSVGTQTDNNGMFSVKAGAGQVLVFSFVGTVTKEIQVGASNIINVTLQNDAQSLKEVVITGALGIRQNAKDLGYTQTTVKGSDIAQTQRENFINGLQGRVAGLNVTSTSGVPGASSSIMIRGVTSLSGNNQPLIVVDGLPIDNKTFNTSALYSDRSAATALYNRGVDFTNRAADINPEDIASITVLKGAEGAALYGIDAANGAIIITTKRGKSGDGAVNYSNSFRIDKINKYPEIQQVYGLGFNGLNEATTNTRYFGTRYQPGTQLYDNINDFFQTGFTQKHNLSFEGGTEKISYRLSTSYTNQKGVVPTTNFKRLNITGSTNATINKWLSTDFSFTYANSSNHQTLQGVGTGGGPLIGLMVWPSTDDARNYLTPSGQRRLLGYTSELENPYFNVNKNGLNDLTNRFISNLGLTVTFNSWLNYHANVGFDVYNSNKTVYRHPESSYALSAGGLLDLANDVNKNLNVQSYFTASRNNIIKNFNITARLGQALMDQDNNVLATYGESWLDPNFMSINAVDQTKIRSLATRTQRRLFGVFGSLQLGYKQLVILNITGRNDWSSTLPFGEDYDNRSFFYPSASLAFNFSDLNYFKDNVSVLSHGKLRASAASVGNDTRPYKVKAALETKPVTGGGFGYGFTGTNNDLEPESTKSYEFGTDLGFFNDRLNLDYTFYKKRGTKQILRDLRRSYATGYVLFDLNAGKIDNWGHEVQLSGIPIQKQNFSWTIMANFTKQKSNVVDLGSLPEFYVSDTWAYGNVRKGTRVGLPVTTFTGYFYQRNNNGDILIDPSTGIPLTSASNTTFIPNGTDTNPDFMIGLTNSFTIKDFSLSFLLDIRKGGDVLNATEHFLTNRGLSLRTLDREESKIIPGVLKDGNENSANPTPNNIIITPYNRSLYYNSMNEEPFIEKDINWVRLRDVTLTYRLPKRLLQRSNVFKSASVFITATDLFLITNYSGLDPVGSGNSAAVGGAGGMGIDYGNFPIPRGINFGVKVGL